jgi:hypothetical protein
MVFNPVKRTVLICAVLIFLAACSPVTQAPASGGAVDVQQTQASSNAESQLGSGIDACALLTKADAEAALGKETDAGTPGDVPPLYSCSYETGELDIVHLIVVVYNSPAQAEAAFDMAIEINGYPEILNFGERMYNAQPIFDVNFLHNNLEISIDISDSTELESQLQRSLELARLVLARLP